MNIDKAIAELSVIYEQIEKVKKERVTLYTSDGLKVARIPLDGDYLEALDFAIKSLQAWNSVDVELLKLPKDAHFNQYELGFNEGVFTSLRLVNAKKQQLTAEEKLREEYEKLQEELYGRIF